MGWFNKNKKQLSLVKEARLELNRKLELIHENYIEKVKKEDVPILPILPIGKCWTEVIEGIQVIEPTFPYDKSKETVFIIQAKGGTSIGPHRHYEEEYVHVIEGTFREVVSGDMNTYGNTLKLNKLQPHGMDFLEDTIVIVHWKTLK